jgi:AraC-like ligand binding domain
MSDYEVTRLDDVDRLGNWQPLRRRLGIGAFGINAWTGDEEGAEIIGEHDEKPTGHEELYLVLEGQARFTVGGDSFDADAGTIVFVPDPELRRGAVATEPGTRILTVGAKRGEAYRGQGASRGRGGRVPGRRRAALQPRLRGGAARRA